MLRVVVCFKTCLIAAGTLTNFLAANRVAGRSTKHRQLQLPLAYKIRVPTLIVTAQDDPHHPAIVGNRSITLVAPEHGGHCAFISRNGGRERFWAESRVVEFCAEHSEIVKYAGPHSESGDLLTPGTHTKAERGQGLTSFARENHS